ncbi:hypothetical protein J5N97_020096 [Dioscorea zingiberensis]|uniref:Amino acid transporter transmembrane domain-containing protein n=1 Tax=Dioscorea zingiberensis TaxID=325984 RepID=A0A9D5HDC2_9LILI|nr:hypothetical protein J5N97_020096 [Dioscorea zingiberensis]
MEEIVAVDDGRIRTGTVWSATAHASTAIVGTGVLALPWSVAQLGWILGPLAIISFALVTYYTAVLLCDCYRSPDPVTGRRNYTYMDAIRTCLGERDVFLCGIAQYAVLWGTMVGYSITSAMCVLAIKISNCVHKLGRNASCKVSGIKYVMIFTVIQMLLSQIPNLEKIALISYIAVAMSLVYSSIALYLCVADFFYHPKPRGTFFGVKPGMTNISRLTKVWFSFQALGNIAFSYSYSMLLIEIEDTLRSPPPENETMKRASRYSIGTITLFYASLGCAGYATLGNDVPGNILTGFYEPSWLIDIANLSVLVHLIGAYQVFAQPIFSRYEKWLSARWPNSSFFNKVYTFKVPFTASKSFKFTLCKLLFRPSFVIFTTAVAMTLPFFNAVLGLFGALSFWPLSVHYPVTMYITQAKIKRGNRKWMVLQTMSLICLFVSIAGAIGSVADIIDRLKRAKFFKVEL